MELEFVSRGKSPDNLDPSAVSSQRESVKAKILAAQNSAILDKYLQYMDQQIHILTKVAPYISKEDFSLDIIRIFHQLFQEGFAYYKHEQEEIVSRFKFCIAQYHTYFPEMKGQNFFNGTTRATLLNLSDTGTIQYAQVNKGYMFI